MNIDKVIGQMYFEQFRESNKQSWFEFLNTFENVNIQLEIVSNCKHLFELSDWQQIKNNNMDFFLQILIENPELFILKHLLNLQEKVDLLSIHNQTVQTEIYTQVERLNDQILETKTLIDCLKHELESHIAI
jgi:hypothetical protein